MLDFLESSTIVDKNNETNHKIYRKVPFLMYTEMVKFRPQSNFETKTTPRTWALGCHPRDNGHLTH